MPQRTTGLAYYSSQETVMNGAPASEFVYAAVYVAIYATIYAATCTGSSA